MEVIKIMTDNGYIDLNIHNESEMDIDVKEDLEKTLDLSEVSVNINEER